MSEISDHTVQQQLLLKRLVLPPKLQCGSANLFQRGLAHGVVGDVEVLFALLEQFEQAGQPHLRTGSARGAVSVGVRACARECVCVCVCVFGRAGVR